VLSAVLIAAALAAAPAHAEDALSRAGDASSASLAAASARTPADAKELSSLAFQGGSPAQNAVSADGRSLSRSNLALSKPAASTKLASAGVPKPLDIAGAGSLPLPSPTSFIARTALGIAAGVVTGVAAAWLFAKKRYVEAGGVALGALAGGLLFGPIGALAGAALGGLLGHFGARLFKRG
jgi:hypothetical protein